MLSLMKGVVAVVLASLGFQVLAERLDFSQAFAVPAGISEMGGENLGGE